MGLGETKNIKISSLDFITENESVSITLPLNHAYWTIYLHSSLRKCLIFLPLAGLLNFEFILERYIV